MGCSFCALFTLSLLPPLAPRASFFQICLSLSFCLRSNNSSLLISKDIRSKDMGFKLTLVSTTRLGFHLVREKENKQWHGGVTPDDKAFHWQASAVLFVTLHPVCTFMKTYQSPKPTETIRSPLQQLSTPLKSDSGQRMRTVNLNSNNQLKLHSIRD